MDVFASLGIIILSMLIVASLQLASGVFLLFSHYAYGKRSNRKASDFTLFFIFGTETCIALVLTLIYFILSSLYFTSINFSNGILYWILAGILMALGVLFPICYYRKGSGTELFISRRTVQALDFKARSVKTRSDAFILGFISAAPELVFTLPVFIISALTIMRVSSDPIPRALLILALALATISPLLLNRARFSLGYNLADLAKSRTKNKTFIRLFVSVVYFIIAILIIAFGVNPL